MKNTAKPKLPLIIRISIPQTKFDMDAVDAEVYCLNETENVFFISTKSESFTTIDEEVGTTAEHGSDPMMKKLLQGEFIKVAEVKGWEWDGHVGIEIAFRQEGNEKPITKSYDLKTSKSDFKFPSGKMGRVIPPTK